MNGIPNRNVRWMIRLFLLLLVATPVTTAQRALAATPEYAGEWEITFEVVNSKIHALWNGRVWDYAEGDGVIVAEKSVDITSDCEIIGGPVFAESEVKFDGIDDYVRCRIPNFPALLVAMVPELQKCRCYYDGPPYVAADVTPAYSQTAQPVVYHNRLYMDVLHLDTKSLRFPFIDTGEGVLPAGQAGVDSNNSLAVAELTLRFLDSSIQEWQSQRFSLWQQNGYQIWAGYDAIRYTTNNAKDGFGKFLADAGFWDVVKPEHAGGFFMWESEAKLVFSGEAMPSGFGLGPGTYVYFGHNPEAGTFFNGVVRAIAVDPGCRGH